MKIKFKNGEILEVEYQIANIIYNTITTTGAKKWQCFKDDVDRVVLMINLDEVICFK